MAWIGLLTHPFPESHRRFLHRFLQVKILHSHFYATLQYPKIQPAMTCSKLTIETLEQGVK